MTIRPVIFRRQARMEFDEAALWYEAHRRGLGARITFAVDSVINSAALNPDRHPRVFADVHEGLVSGFPYCVYYRQEHGRILVIGIFHASRDPSIWQSRG